jgi:hypothetical protein
MSIAFSCPNCRHVFQAPDEAAGRKTRCSHCGQPLQVPLLEAKLASDQDEDDEVIVICPGCGRGIPLRTQQLASSVACPDCCRQFVPTTAPPAPAPAQTGPGMGPTPHPPIPNHRPRRRRRRRRVRPAEGWAAISLLGAILFAIGALMTLYFLIVYDTTTYSSSGSFGISGERLHNFGLLGNKIAGTVAGVGLMIVGAIFITGRVQVPLWRPPTRHRTPQRPIAAPLAPSQRAQMPKAGP